MRNPYRDSQTGFYEFDLFCELFQREVDRSRRYARPLSLLVGCWQPHGKDFEISLESLMQWSSLARDVDFLAKMSKTSLLAVLPETDRPGASVTAERFFRSFRKVTDSTGGQAPSLGVVTYPLHGRTVDELLMNGEIQARLSVERRLGQVGAGSIAVGSRV